MPSKHLPWVRFPVGAMAFTFQPLEYLVVTFLIFISSRAWALGTHTNSHVTHPSYVNMIKSKSPPILFGGGQLFLQTELRLRYQLGLGGEWLRWKNIVFVVPKLRNSATKVVFYHAWWHSLCCVLYTQTQLSTLGSTILLDMDAHPSLSMVIW